MKRFLDTYNLLCLPLIAAIAFTTVVVAATDGAAKPVRASPLPTSLVLESGNLGKATSVSGGNVRALLTASDADWRSRRWQD